MAPVRTKKRVSSASTAAKRAERFDAIVASGQAGDDAQDAARRSPTKRTRMGISLAQKEALIENLQLELTERARRLRAQYNLQAQGLRTRVEIRVNRIPTALRRLKMGDLLAKHIANQQQQRRRIVSDSNPPPVPAKDYPPTRTASPQKHPFGPPLFPASARLTKRKSGRLGGHDKENDTISDISKKRLRAVAGTSEAMEIEPSNVLSPASSNSRIAPRPLEKPAPPPKPEWSRPASPIKAATLPASGRAANILANMVDKAKNTRGVVNITSEKTTDLSSAGHTAHRTTTARNRGAPTPVPAPAVAAPLRKGATSRNGKRTSVSSESSSSSAAGRKPAAASRAPSKTLGQTLGQSQAPSAKRTVMGTIRKGVAGATTKKPTDPRPTTVSTTAGAGRVLRRRA